jgi:hypothetical protein
VAGKPNGPEGGDTVKTIEDPKKNKKLRKLVLTRETIRRISESRLPEVVGGWGGGPYCSCTPACPTD